MSTRSENHGNSYFLDFQKVEPKSYSSKMKQKNSTKLWGHAEITIKGRTVGCRGGSRYFERVCGFLEILKIQNIDLPKIQRFHADPKLFGNPKDSTI